MTQYLNLGSNHRLAYKIYKSTKPNSLNVLYCGGFRSEMLDIQPISLMQWCANQNFNFLCFDYFGHGQSTGEFKDGTLGVWKKNIISVLDELTTGPQVVVGSSMGAWLMILAARERKERIHAMIGVAAAPNFTEQLFWNRWSDETKHNIQKNGFITEPATDQYESYPVTYNLILEARQHLLSSDKIDLNCPIRLIHGMSDTVSSFQESIYLCELFSSNEVIINLIKHGDHYLCKQNELEIIYKNISSFLNSNKCITYL